MSVLAAIWVLVAMMVGMSIVWILLGIISVLFIVAAAIVNVIDIVALLRLPYRNRKRKI